MPHFGGRFRPQHAVEGSGLGFFSIPGAVARDDIGCENVFKCKKHFFRPGCLGMPIFDIPRQGP